MHAKILFWFWLAVLTSHLCFDAASARHFHNRVLGGVFYDTNLRRGGNGLACTNGLLRGGAADVTAIVPLKFYCFGLEDTTCCLFHTLCLSRSEPIVIKPDSQCAGCRYLRLKFPGLYRKPMDPSALRPGRHVRAAGGAGFVVFFAPDCLRPTGLPLPSEGFAPSAASSNHSRSYFHSFNFTDRPNKALACS